jgi:Zn-dependent peptidase ImmA (M78 family)
MNWVLPEAFRAECEELALELRREIGLDSQDRLNPRRRAEDMAIDVFTIERFRDHYPEAVDQLAEHDAEAFDAMVVFHGTRCLILVNPSQSPEEEALSIAHEIAHIELEHERLEAPLFDEAGRRRSWHPRDEAEAECLARTMLVPEVAIGPVLRDCNGSIRDAAGHFGVSVATMCRRMEETGHPVDTMQAAIATAEERVAGIQLSRRLLPNRPEEGAGGAEPAPSPAG